MSAPKTVAELRLQILQAAWDQGETLTEAELQNRFERRATGATDAEARTDEPPDATGATTTTQPVGGIFRPLLDPDQIELAQVLSVVIQTKGVDVRRELRRFWGVHKSTVQRRVRKWRKYVATTGRQIGGSYRYTVTRYGDSWWRQMKEASWDSGLMPDLKKSLVKPGPAGDAPVQGGASEGTGATDARPEGELQPGSPVAPRSDWGPIRPSMDTYFGGPSPATIEKFEIQAVMIDDPEEIPTEWIAMNFKPHRQGKDGGLMYNKAEKCRPSCGCSGRGWVYQLTYKQGEAHKLRVAHPAKRPGRSIPDLLYDQERQGRYRLEEEAKRLGVRIENPRVLPYELEVRDDTAKEVLEAAVPAGHSAEVVSAVTGNRFTVNKSSWGKYGSADRGFEKLEDFQDWVLQAENARVGRELAEVAERRSSKILLAMREHDQVLKVVESSLESLTNIVAKRALLDTKKRVTEL